MTRHETVYLTCDRSSQNDICHPGICHREISRVEIWEHPKPQWSRAADVTFVLAWDEAGLLVVRMIRARLGGASFCRADALLFGQPVDIWERNAAAAARQQVAA